MMGDLKRRVGHLLERLFPVIWLRLRIWRRDRHFEREFFTLGPLCHPDRLAVDVGGNAGEYAYWLSLHACHVIAYEPNPECHRAITRLGRPNITLRPVALSDRAGVAALVFQQGNSGIGSIAGENPISTRAGTPDHVRLEVVTVPLDEEGLEAVGLIKIDVEGHEAAVLAGASSLIARDRPRLMIEIEERHRPGAHDLVRDLLAPLGYDRFVFQQGRIIPYPWNLDPRSLQRDPPGSPGYLNNFFFFHRQDSVIAGISRNTA
jgi:FkbM family methyltransferase